MDAERFIAAIKAEQAATALDGLLKPQARDAFQYGHHSGYVMGLERAITLLTDQLDAAAGKGATKPKGPAAKVNPYTQDMDDAPSLPEQYHNR